MYRKKQTKTKKEQDDESYSNYDTNHDYDDERTVFIKEFDLNEMPPNSPEDNNGVKLVVIGKPGCFAPGTEIMMYDGSIKKVEDVSIGDKVMGDDGETYRTVQKLYHDEDMMYDIYTKRGTSYTVNSRHPLVLKYDDKIVEIPVIDYLKIDEDLKKEYMCLRSTGINCWQDKDIVIDPYFLGVWLSDKNSSLLPENIRKDILEYDCIPNNYKLSSRETRLKLLAGIIDSTDFTISNTNEKFIDDIVFILKSLGFYANKIFQVEDNKEIYKCKIYGENLDIIPTLVKKFDAIQNNYFEYSSSFEIKEKGFGEYFGFELDGNKRFLLSSFEIVHNTGKSSIISSIVDSKKHIIPVSQIFSGTEDSNGFYCSKFPSITVFNDIKDLKPIENFVTRQKYSKRYLYNPWAVQIIDDCTDDPKLFTKPLFQSYYKNGRHWKMMHILSLQYCLDIKPVIRTNIDYTFILRETNKKNRKSLFENYASCVDNLRDFESLLDQLTTDYCSMVVVNRSQSNNIEDCIRWYKADLEKIKNFKFGCDDFWLFNNQRLEENYVDTYSI